MRALRSTKPSSTGAADGDYAIFAAGMSRKPSADRAQARGRALASPQVVFQKCVETGATWVHLRTCQECGGTHCCDIRPTSTPPGTRATGHPAIASAEPGERWLYCYPDAASAEY